MPKKKKYQLNESDLSQIEQAIKTAPEARVRQRATGLRLLHLGKKPGEVAELLHVSQATVYNWHARWLEGGYAGLSDAVRAGRPKLSTADYCQKLETLVQQDPQALGYGFTVWTIDRLRAHLAQKTGIEMSDETFRQVLQENDFVYRRPKHDLKPLQDEEARTRTGELLDDLKKKPKQARSNYSLWTKSP